MESRFVQNAPSPSLARIQNVDKHCDVVAKDVANAEPEADITTRALKFYARANKVYNRLVNNHLTVYDAKTFKVEDMLVRDDTELGLVVNYRKQTMFDKLNIGKRLYKKLMSK